MFIPSFDLSSRMNRNFFVIKYNYFCKKAVLPGWIGAQKQ